MKKLNLGGSGLFASEIALGAMRYADKSPQEINTLIGAALELGYDYYDHADIYGGGKSEEVFGQALRLSPGLRDKITIQLKCGIRGGMYDFSKEHILTAVEGSLTRLGLESAEVLLLHRPDTLAEPEEVAAAFDKLEESGKIGRFGVSNQTPLMMELLSKRVRQKLIINQVQFSPAHTGIINSGINANTSFAGSIDRDGGILEYCRLKDITIQPWSPFQKGWFGGAYIGDPELPELNAALERFAQSRGVTKNAAAIAWILRHPAKMQPIIGTTNIGRITDTAAASGADMSRKEWYEIYLAAGNNLP